MNKIYVLKTKIDTFARKDELVALALPHEVKGYYFDLDDDRVDELHRELFGRGKPVCSRCGGPHRVSKCPIPPKPETALPRDKWPAWTALVEKFRNDSDVGIGDTIERMAGGAGELFKKWYKVITGHPCGCDGRKDTFNQLYPYT